MKTGYVVFLLIWVLSSLWGGCSDDVKKSDLKDSDADSDSAVSGDTPVQDLSDDEMAAFCSELFDASMVVIEPFRVAASEKVCALAGAQAAEAIAQNGGSDVQIVTACQVMTETCETNNVDTLLQMAQVFTGVQTEGTLCQSVQDMFEGCDATKDEMSSCYLAMLEAELNDTTESMATLPECTAYSAAWFGDTDTGEESAIDLTDLPLPCLILAARCPDLAMSLAGDELF